LNTDQPFNSPTDMVMRLIWMGLVIDALRIAWRGRNDDLVEARRRIRTGFVWTVGAAHFIVTAVFFYYNQYLGMFAPWAVQLPMDVAVLLLTVGLFVALTGIRDPDLFSAKPNGKDKAETLDEETSDAIVARLTAHMEAERAWRDERLTIATLAAQIGEQEYRLRRVINGRMGYRNFAAFLNGYRLEEVKAALADPEQKDVPILTIALDAGFGSLGPFNRAFREAEGMTPSAYRTGGESV
jgi:AraC-like DNA-binding protein